MSEHEIAYMVDGVKQKTSEKEMTPRAILTQANLNPEERYLIGLTKGETPHSYQDAMDTAIKMHKGAEFITAAMGPTPLS